MPQLRLLLSLFYYFALFVAYRETILWVKPDLFAMEGGKALFVTVLVPYLAIAILISEIYDDKQGLRADLIDVILGRK